jgi:hypothetical protein
MPNSTDGRKRIDALDEWMTPELAEIKEQSEDQRAEEG